MSTTALSITPQTQVDRQLQEHEEWIRKLPEDQQIDCLNQAIVKAWSLVERNQIQQELVEA